MTTTLPTAHEWRFGTDESPHLHLRSHYADVRIAHDAGPGDVIVRVLADGGFQPDLIDTRTSGRDVHVLVPRLGPSGDEVVGMALGWLSRVMGAGRRVTVEVQLPPEADLTVHVDGGDVSCTGRAGRADLETGGGDLRLQDAGWARAVTQGGDITAEALDRGELRTGGGDIRVRRLGEGSVKSAGGDVRLDELGSGRIETGGGDVQVGRAAGDLAVHTGAGDVSVSHCAGDTHVRTGAGDVTIEAVGGQVTVGTGVGDVRILVPAGMPVWQDLHSSFGEVRSRIAGRGEPRDGEPFLQVSARTGMGDVVLES